MFLPPRLLPAQISAWNFAAFWNEDDGGPWVGAPYRWSMTVNVTAQTHGSHLTREPFSYNGLDIAVGDWFADIPYGRAVRVVSVTSSTDLDATVVVEDVDRFNTITSNGQGIGEVGADGFFFSLSDTGQPILGPASTTTLLGANPAWVGDQISRFAYRNLVQSFFRVEQPGHTLAVGDVVRIRTEAPDQGEYEKVVQGQSVEGVVGVVNSVGTPGVNWFTFRPSGRVVANLAPLLPGSPGEFIYLDGLGAYTATRPNAFAKPIFIRLSGNGSLGLQLDRNVDSTPPTTGYIAQTYVVATIAERDLLIGLNDGDQVKVRDSGNGEWSQFLYDDGQWNLLVTQDASNTDAETLDVQITAETTTGTLGVISRDSSISIIAVVVEEAFSANAMLTIGTTGEDDAFMGPLLSDLTLPAVYTASPSVVVSSETPVTYTLSGATGTTGRATVSVSYL